MEITHTRGGVLSVTTTGRADGGVNGFLAVFRFSPFVISGEAGRETITATRARDRSIRFGEIATEETRAESVRGPPTGCNVGRLCGPRPSVHHLLSFNARYI